MQSHIEISINNILYQRGIYPEDEFDRTKRYGLNLHITSNPALKQYMETIFKQLQGKYTVKSFEYIFILKQTG